MNCGRAEGTACPSYEYGCADGSYYYVEINDPNCPVGIMDAGVMDAVLIPADGATTDGPPDSSTD